jgi:response regulator RpfG family c-di-GMP phosphodiesterase
MEEAIGSKIADYLIKNLNPNQILLSLKKNLDHSRLFQKNNFNYQQEFRKKLYRFSHGKLKKIRMD